MIRFNLGSILYWITGPFKDRYPLLSNRSPSGIQTVTAHRLASLDPSWITDARAYIRLLIPLCPCILAHTPVAYLINLFQSSSSL